LGGTAGVERAGWRERVWDVAGPNGSGLGTICRAGRLLLVILDLLLLLMELMRASVFPLIPLQPTTLLTEEVVMGTLAAEDCVCETDGPPAALEIEAAPAIGAEDCRVVVGTDAPWGVCLVVDGGRTDDCGCTLLTTCTFTVFGTRTLDVVTHKLTRGPHVATVLGALVPGKGRSTLLTTVVVDEPVDDTLAGLEVLAELALLRLMPNRSARFVVGWREYNFSLPLNLAVVVLRSDERVSEAA
jgi:hypothetical protein